MTTINCSLAEFFGKNPRMSMVINSKACWQRTVSGGVFSWRRCLFSSSHGSHHLFFECCRPCAANRAGVSRCLTWDTPLRVPPFLENERDKAGLAEGNLVPQFVPQYGEGWWKRRFHNGHASNTWAVTPTVAPTFWEMHLWPDLLTVLPKRVELYSSLI